MQKLQRFSSETTLPDKTGPRVRNHKSKTKVRGNEERKVELIGGDCWMKYQHDDVDVFMTSLNVGEADNTKLVSH